MGLKVKLKFGGSGVAGSSDNKSQALPDHSAPAPRPAIDRHDASAALASSDEPAAPQGKRKIKLSIGKSKDGAARAPMAPLEPALKKQKTSPSSGAAAPFAQPHAFQLPSARSLSLPPLQPSSSVASQSSLPGTEAKKTGIRIKFKTKGGAAAPPVGGVPAGQPWHATTAAQVDPFLRDSAALPPRAGQYDAKVNVQPTPAAPLQPAQQRGVNGSHAPASMALPAAQPRAAQAPLLPSLGASRGVGAAARPPGGGVPAFTAGYAPPPVPGARKHIVSIKIKRKGDGGVPVPSIKAPGAAGKLANALPGPAPPRLNQLQRAPLYPKSNAPTQPMRIKLKRPVASGALAKPAAPVPVVVAPSVKGRVLAPVPQPRAVPGLAKLKKPKAAGAVGRAPAPKSALAEAAARGKAGFKAKRGRGPPGRGGAAPARAAQVAAAAAHAAAAAAAQQQMDELEPNYRDKDKGLPDVPSKVLRKLLNLLIKDDKKTGWFQKPVTEDLAPNYFKFIKEPMDYSTIKAKLNRKAYKTFGDMQADVRLMFRNATVFNPVGSPVHSKALELLGKSEEKFDEARNLWRDECALGRGDGGAMTQSAAPSASAADSLGTRGREIGEVMSRAKRENASAASNVLPPRRDEYATARPRGRPGRKPNVAAGRAGVPRVHAAGTQRTTTVNARASYVQRIHPARAVWGALIMGTSAEGGIQWAQQRAKIAHAYQNREIDQETCARKLAFFGPGLTGSARRELLRRASLTILRRRKAGTEMAVPGPASVQRPPPHPAQPLTAAAQHAAVAAHNAALHAAAAAAPGMYGAQYAARPIHAAAGYTVQQQQQFAAQYAQLNGYQALAPGGHAAAQVHAHLAPTNGASAAPVARAGPGFGAQAHVAAAQPAGHAAPKAAAPATPKSAANGASQHNVRSAPDSPDVVDLR